MLTNFPLITPETKKLPFYVTGIGTKYNQNRISRKKGLNCYQWSICTDGEGVFRSGGKSYTVSCGDGFFFRAGIPHEYYASKKPWTVKWVTFSGSQVGSVLDLLGLGDFHTFSLKSPKKFERIIEEINLILASKSMNKNTLCSSLIYSLLINWGTEKNYMPQESAKNMQSRINPVLKFMEQNYDKDISLSELASVIDVSPNFLCRIFKESCNTTPVKYLVSLRIQKAKFFFSNFGNLLIKDVAEKVGFHDTSYFCSVFKEIEGVSPSEFQKIHGLK